MINNSDYYWKKIKSGIPFALHHNTTYAYLYTHTYTNNSGATWGVILLPLIKFSISTQSFRSNLVTSMYKLKDITG